MHGCRILLLYSYWMLVYIRMKIKLLSTLCITHDEGDSMMHNLLWKRLKGRIRRRFKAQKKLVWGAARLAFAFSAAVAIIVLAFGGRTVAAERIIIAETEELSSWFGNGKQLRGILHKVYVCGEEIVNLDMLSYEDAVILAEQNPHWQLSVDQTHQLIRFEEKIEDLSPYCKANAFFGIDDEGLFSLYDGIPEREKIMKTFFQLNIRYLESRLPKQELEHLQNGIRVRDLEEYDSVLSTFNEFRLDRISQ